jgi:hypothetical protein
VSFAQNLQYKWVEGLYYAPPFVADYLSWVHGTFQVPPRVTHIHIHTRAHRQTDRHNQTHTYMRARARCVGEQVPP